MGWSRRNFMVPLPRFASFEAFNEYLEQRCRERQGDVLRGHRESIGERLKRDLEAMAALPAAPFDACHQAPGQVSSQSLVRYRNNDYSVPVAYGHHRVWVRGYVEQVVIGCGAQIIARHRRSYEGEDTVFDPLHYLPLIERKIAALDQAAPLAGWELPDAFATLRRLMEARSGRAGRREYVQVLRLLETFGMDDVHAAVKHALRLGAIGFDAVKHLVLCRVEKRPPRLDLDVYPYLELTRFRGRLRTVATKRSDVDPLDFVERDLLAEAVVELGGAGGLMPGDPGRDLKVAAVSKVLGDPGPAEAVGADLGW